MVLNFTPASSTLLIRAPRCWHLHSLVRIVTSLFKRSKRASVRAVAVAVALAATATMAPAHAADVARETAHTINAALVNLRSAPNAEAPLLSQLREGEPVQLLGAGVEGGRYCHVQVRATHEVGYVACRFLGSGAGGASDPGAGRRWVAGTGLRLRAQPSAHAPERATLALNQPVALLAADLGDNAAFCEVSTIGADGRALRGFAACRYISSEPFVYEWLLTPTLSDGKPNAAFDPVRAFRVQPSLRALIAHATELERRRVQPVEETHAGRRTEHELARYQADLAVAVSQIQHTPDRELDAMKATLARGIAVAPVEPLKPWLSLKSQATRLNAIKPDDKLEEGQHGNTPSTLAHELSMALGVYDVTVEPHDTSPRVIHPAPALVEVIELPTAQPSLFHEGDVAGLNEGVEQVAGRFGILLTHKMAPRRAPAGEEGVTDGVWDMQSVTRALLRPVHASTIFRDGRVQSRRSTLAVTDALHGIDRDPPECEGFVYGFTHGDADPQMVREHLGDAATVQLRGSLLRLVTRWPLPDAAQRSVTSMGLSLDRERTGFVRATQMHIDLDGDSKPDLVSWEGVGHGRGHLEGPTTSDDAWVRLFFVNIAGVWHVLGSDTFAYGCGC